LQTIPPAGILLFHLGIIEIFADLAVGSPIRRRNVWSGLAVKQKDDRQNSRLPGEKGDVRLRRTSQERSSIPAFGWFTDPSQLVRRVKQFPGLKSASAGRILFVSPF
jgi:hypothetical protein